MSVWVTVVHSRGPVSMTNPHRTTAQGRAACIPCTESTALGRGVPFGGPQGQLGWHEAPTAASVPEGPQGKDCMPRNAPSQRLEPGSLAGSLRSGLPETSTQAGPMQEHKGERPKWRSDFPRSWGFLSGPQGWWPRQGHRRLPRRHHGPAWGTGRPPGRSARHSPPSVRSPTKCF